MSQKQTSDLHFLRYDSREVARLLLGYDLVLGEVRVRIVETEAYMENDPASHAVTRRNSAWDVMSTWGRVYVYQIYGVHFCLNISTDESQAGAVLIRAAEPIEGVTQMKMNRGVTSLRALTNGPGKLCRAMGVDKTLSGKMIGDQIALYRGVTIPDSGVMRSPRVGISVAREKMWRFFVAECDFVSRVGENRLAVPFEK